LVVIFSTDAISAVLGAFSGKVTVNPSLLCLNLSLPYPSNSTFLTLSFLAGDVFENAYKELDGVQNGSQAMNAFARLGSLDEKEKLKLRNSLLEYCKLDTLAMVKILEKLKKEVNNI
jgi:hypothetical protein